MLQGVAADNQIGADGQVFGTDALKAASKNLYGGVFLLPFPSFPNRINTNPVVSPVSQPLQKIEIIAAYIENARKPSLWSEVFQTGEKEIGSFSGSAARGCTETVLVPVENRRRDDIPKLAMAAVRAVEQGLVDPFRRCFSRGG